jgi:hypothetical protein
VTTLAAGAAFASGEVDVEDVEPPGFEQTTRVRGAAQRIQRIIVQESDKQVSFVCRVILEEGEMVTWPDTNRPNYGQDVIDLITRDPIGALAAGRVSDKITNSCWDQLEPLQERHYEEFDPAARDQLKNDIRALMLRLWKLRACC